MRKAYQQTSVRLVVMRNSDGTNREYELRYMCSVISVPVAVFHPRSGRVEFGCRDYLWNGDTNVMGLPVYREIDGR